jgi:hypothetical protein
MNSVRKIDQLALLAEATVGIITAAGRIAAVQVFWLLGNNLCSRCCRKNVHDSKIANSYDETLTVAIIYCLIWVTTQQQFVLNL